ncbi:MAG: EAL domain-containing protein, partial [Methyloprofundus sp.]|nr:EAL domain-containing protein [Methyloprofundus sp.]
MNRVTKALPIFFMLAMLILASSLYSLAQIDYKAYQNKINLIRNINEQASQLSLAVFLVAERVKTDYDHITLIKQRLVKHTKQLRLHSPPDAALYQSTLNLVEQVEQVKSLHAIYRNSLLFFPKATSQLHLRLNDINQATEIIEQLNTLEHQFVSFNISSDTINQPELLQSISAIENNPGISNLDVETRLHFDLLVKHINLIINYQQQLKSLYASILSSPISERAHHLLSIYSTGFQARLKKAAIIKKGFYITTLFLISSVILVLSQLKTTLTKLHRNERAMSLAATVFEHSPEGIVLADADNKILQINAAFSKVTGYSTEDVIGQNPGMLSSGKQSDEFYQDMWQTLHSQGKWSGELYNRRKNGEVYPEYLTIIAIKNNQHKLTHHIAIFNDLSEQKKAEQHIHFLAHYDPLTQLANRSLFTERLQQAISKSQRSDKSVALLFIDLDRFKEVNDSYGHKAGDQLLIQVANDIRSCIRDSDSAARLGGDEFIITIEDLSHDELIISTPIVASKILTALAHKYRLEMAHAYIGASIGIAFYPEDALTADTLLQCADMAMYHAKEQGKNNYQFYSSKLNEKAKRRTYLEQELRLALSRNQLFLHYQPQYNILSKKIESFEALIRWRHPELGLLPPDEFITIAEDIGIIVKIGLWVLQTAVRQLIIWQKTFDPKLSMAVNISVKQLENNDLSQSIESLLKFTQLHPETLELEVTENILIDDDSVMLANLHKLYRLGIQISMDDFGTGYSNMNYLKKLPIERIKIDRCFISDIPQDNNNAAIAQAIIAMAQSFNFKVIAEGIETKEQEEFLLKQGCYTGQGFLFSRPIPAEKATKLLFDNY